MDLGGRLHAEAHVGSLLVVECDELAYPFELLAQFRIVRPLGSPYFAAVCSAVISLST